MHYAGNVHSLHVPVSSSSAWLKHSHRSSAISPPRTDSAARAVRARVESEQRRCQNRRKMRGEMQAGGRMQRGKPRLNFTMLANLSCAFGSKR